MLVVYLDEEQNIQTLSDNCAKRFHSNPCLL